VTDIRHFKETAELACLQQRDNPETLEQAHKRIDRLENLICELIRNIQGRFGDGGNGPA
jgi:hypothetical protein